MNDNCSEMNKRDDEWEERAIQFAFLLHQDYLSKLRWLKMKIDNGDSLDSLKDTINSYVQNEWEERAIQFAFPLHQDYLSELRWLKMKIDNGDSLDSLKDMINRYVQNAWDDDQKISNICEHMNFDTGVYANCCNFREIMIEFVRNQACKLNDAADEMERKYRGGRTLKEMEDMYRKNDEKHRESEQRRVLNGRTVQEAADELAQRLNKGYTYTYIMDKIKELLDGEYRVLAEDPDSYDKGVHYTCKKSLLIKLKLAGVNVSKVKDYLSTISKK